MRWPSPAQPCFLAPSPPSRLLLLPSCRLAVFQGLTNAANTSSGDVAVLALAKDSTAPYVALPISDIPAAGDFINQTAFDEEARWIAYANLTVNASCPEGAGWADTFCANGTDLLTEECPHDKGSPALLFNGTTTLQVGLTSGLGCAEGTAEEPFAIFVKLADKEVLATIISYLNER